MSKEQWSAKDGQVGPASDVYSLGMILYELLTGNLPYDVDDDEPATAWFVKLVTQTQALPREFRPTIDRELESIVMLAIAREPEERIQSMEDLADRLDHWLDGDSLQSSRSRQLDVSEDDFENEPSVRRGSRSSSTLQSKKSLLRSVRMDQRSKRRQGTADSRSPLVYMVLGVFTTVLFGLGLFWKFRPVEPDLPTTEATASESASNRPIEKDATSIDDVSSIIPESLQPKVSDNDAAMAAESSIPSAANSGTAPSRQ